MMYLDKKRYIISNYIRSSLWLLFLFINACQPDLPEYTWRGDITDGTWTIWVEAIDNEGEKTTSPPITVTLYHP